MHKSETVRKEILGTLHNSLVTAWMILQQSNHAQVAAAPGTCSAVPLCKHIDQAKISEQLVHL